MLDIGNNPVHMEREPKTRLCHAQVLGITLPLLRRDPHYFLPTTGEKYLLFGTDHAAMRSQFIKFFSEQDWQADCRMQVGHQQCCYGYTNVCSREPVRVR